MIPALKPYPGYKDSSVQWLGAVPEHWEVRRMRNVAELRVSTIDKHVREDELPVRLCNYVDVYKNDRIRPGMSFMSATARAEDISRFRLEDGDVLITKDSEVWTDIGVPALVEGRADDLVSGYHLALLRPRAQTCVGAFLLRALQSRPVAYQLHVEATGVTRYGLSHDAIKSVWLPAPPLPEQHSIVRYLDYMDRRIRRYIRTKQKVIKLLEEEKQGIIHRAVTGQVDVRTGQPYPTYKPSGVEWLGDVPAEWEVVPLKRAFVSLDYGVSESATDHGNIRLLTMAHIRAGEVNVPESGGLSKVDRELTLQPGDLLFNRTNSLELVAKVGLFKGWETPVSFASYLVRMRPRAPHRAEYLNMLLNDIAFLRAARREAIPSLHQANLNPTRYGRLPIPLPGEAEQSTIVEHLEDEAARVNRAVEREARLIEFVRKYRTRLIADVVTGKLDVREAAALLPHEIEEPLQDAELPGDESLEGEDLLEPEDADA